MKQSHSFNRCLGVTLFIAVLLSATAWAEYTLTLQTDGPGQILVDPNLEFYLPGTEVTLTAVPDDLHAALVGWVGHAGQEDQITVVMDADKQVTAQFGEVIPVGPHRYAFGGLKNSLATPAPTGQAFVSSDGLSLYYVAPQYEDTPVNVISLYRVTRTDIDAPWGEPVDLIGENMNRGLHYNQIFSPSLTEDGLTLYYQTLLTNSIGSWPQAGRELMVRRDAVANGFDFSQAVEVFTEAGDVGPFSVTRDGTGVVYTSPNTGGSVGSIWYAPLDPVTQFLGRAPELVAFEPGTRFTNPEMSADGLTVMFWNTGAPNTIYMVSRSAIGNPWSQPVSLPSPLADRSEEDVTLSADLTRIYLGSYRSGTTTLDPRDPRGAPPGGGGYDVFEAKMRRLPLIGHWALDEPGGRGGRVTLAQDDVAFNDGSVLGRAVSQPELGVIDGALSFDGIDDCIILPVFVHPAGGPFGFHVWVQGGHPGQVLLSEDGGANWLMIDAEGRLVSEAIGSDPLAAPLPTDVILDDGQWHHVALVWDGLARTIYVDSMPVATDLLENIPIRSQRLIVGANSTDGPGVFWYGMMDDIWMYHDVVTP